MKKLKVMNKVSDICYVLAFNLIGQIKDSLMQIATLTVVKLNLNSRMSVKK